MHAHHVLLLCIAWPSHALVDRSRSRSQAGQDLWLWDNVFSDQPDLGTGFFIEFGARDGVHESNSYFFEKEMLWRGILAEAVPSEHGQIAQNRPRSAAINGAVCESDEPALFTLGPKFADASHGGLSG